MVELKYIELVVENGLEIPVPLERVIDGPVLFQKHSGGVVVIVVAWLEEAK